VIPLRCDIDSYVKDMKADVEDWRYRIERNENRRDNNQLFEDYVIDEAKAREILLSIETKDFSSVVNNVNPRYPNERLYIFGKDVLLVEKYSESEKVVPLYIKFNKLEMKSGSFVIVVSFHEQKRPLTYPFR
jgi:hypothetical protein